MTDQDSGGRFASAIIRMRRIGQSRWRPWLFGLSAVIFVGGSVAAYSSLPPEASDPEWLLLGVVALVMVPLSMTANALEHREIARLAGVDIGIGRAMRTTVIGTAANLAPMPGAAIVRVLDLKRRGVPNGIAIRVNAAGVLLFLAASGAVLLVSVGDEAPLLALGGAATTVGAITAAKYVLPGVRLRRTWRLAAVELWTVVITAARVWLLLRAFSLPGGWTASWPIASSYAYAGAVGLFPAGLGIRELFSGLVAGATIGSVSTGFVVSSVDRLVGMAVHAPTAAFFARTGGPHASHEQ